MEQIRIFSYLPNPRVYKATITGRLNGVSVEVVGATPGELADWLWDFDARPLTEEDRSEGGNTREANTGFSGKLYKTDEFIKAHPYGTVPAVFSPDGKIGIFESNSIMRAVARLGHDKLPLYGDGALEASRIDGFLDTALLFARDSQIYLLGIGDRSVNAAIYDGMESALRKYVSGIDQALQSGSFIVSEQFSIADICFACELSLFARERIAFRILDKISKVPLWDTVMNEFPYALRHFEKLIELPGISEDLGAYVAKIEADIRARR
jgi:glutathione S-transferase